MWKTALRIHILVLLPGRKMPLQRGCYATENYTFLPVAIIIFTGAIRQNFDKLLHGRSRHQIVTELVVVELISLIFVFQMLLPLKKIADGTMGKFEKKDIDLLMITLKYTRKLRMVPL